MERIKLNIQKFADNTIEVELTATVEQLQKSLSTANSSLNKLKNQVSSTKNETDKLKSSAQKIKEAFSGFNLSNAIKSITNLGKSLYNNFLSKAIDTTEELNLFNVVFDNMQENGEKTFSELGKQATKFQNTLNEVFGTNKKETMRYQGLFQAMGESAGIKEDIAMLMSENMTKLAYDLASLYNTTETKAAESLRAGVYAGQTKPLRNYGIDVTQTSFQPIMQELGLEKTVSELTQAEKEILRYISTLRQAQNAMGDFANTIESPANQLKVLKQQFYEMQAAIGNLFTGAFARMLPYINGIIMAIKEVAKAIASFFGIDMKDYNTGIASYANDLDEYSDGLGGVADSAGGASDAIKELKRQTLAFDQINNLTTPTPSSSSGGSGGGVGGGVLGGIDSRLLDAIKGYDNGMDKVRMKATEIRDKLMGFLGFTKHINAETGEVYYTYDGWQKTASNIWEWFTKLNPLAKIFTGLGVAGAIVNIFKALKKIGGLTGVTPVLKGTLTVFKELLSPAADLTKNLFSFSKAALQSEGGIKNLKEGLSTGVQAWREQQGIIDKTTGKLDGFKGALQGAKNFALGLVEGVIGFQTLSASVQDLTTNGANLTNVLGTAGGTLMTVFGGVQAGAVFGPWGAAIGGLIGTIASLGAVILNTDSEIRTLNRRVSETTDETNNYTESLRQSREEHHRLLDESIGVTDYHQKLVNELKAITDENGRVKAGYEDRANFIVTELKDAYGLEMDYSDGVIQGYDDQIGKIDELIEKEKARIRFEAYKEIYKENEKEKATMIKKLVDQQKAYNDVEGEYIKLWSKREDIQKNSYLYGVATIGELKDLKETTNNYNNALNALNGTYDENFQRMIDSNKYQRQLVASTEGNYGKINQISTETYEESLNNLKEAMIKNAELVGIEGEYSVDEWKSLAIGSRDAYKEAISRIPEDTASEIQIMTGEIVKVTPEVVQHFENLGNESEEKMIYKISQLPEDIQKEVINKLEEKGVKIPKELQKGIDSQSKPKVELETTSKSELEDKVNTVIRQVGAVPIEVPINANMDEVYNQLNTFTKHLPPSVRSAFGFEADGGVFANGRWQPIQAYANGGLPSGGQMFIAREAGPELVGKIGKHTAVMNNNQIVDSVKAGVYEAVSAAMSGGIGSVEIVAHTDEGVVIDRINRITRQTGECPINI